MNEVYPELDFPAYLHVETIRACNSRCVFCPYGTGRIADAGPMAENLYDKIEGEILEHAGEIKRVTLHIFGEPLLDRRMEERVARLKRGGIRETSIATNVSLLDEKRAAGLLEAGLDIIKLSITTIDPDKYRVLRQGLDLETVMENAHRYFHLRDKLNPGSKIYVAMERHPDLSDMDVAEWKRHWGDWIGPVDMLKVTTLYDQYAASDDKDKRNGARVRKPCHALFQSMTIANTGDAPPCCGDFMAGESRYIMGNVAEKTIGEVWRGKRFRNFRELHRSGRRDSIPLCAGCDVWDDDLKENVVAGEREAVS